MFEKLKKFYAVFTAGQSVVNAVRLKKIQAAGGLLAGFLGALIAVAKTYGYDIPLTDEQLFNIGGACIAIFGLFNAGATVASTDKLGLPNRGEQDRYLDILVRPNMPTIPTQSGSTMQHKHNTTDNDSDPLEGLDTTFVG